MFKKLFLVFFVGIVLQAQAVASQNNAESHDQLQVKLQSMPQSNPLINMDFSEADYAWIGARIYQNECNSQAKNLTFWGAGEAFPSLGIGHFIWFPEGINPPYNETFPELFKFLSAKSIPPQWLMQLTSFNAPWKNRHTFEQARSTIQMTALRDWLESTQLYQAQFIVAQFGQRWSLAIKQQPLETQRVLNQRLKALLSFKQGGFAVIDYVNFKGVGGNPKEQYQGEEWGLFSVLNHMPYSETGNQQQRLTAFIDSAKQRLQLRTELAPPKRNEQRWLAGWFKRLDGYHQR